MYKYVFFDFNGTILNDIDLCLELLNKILRKQGKKEVTLEKYRCIFGFPVKDYYTRAGIDFNLDSFEDLSIRFIKEYQPRSLKCHLYPHLVEVVKYLKNKNVKVGVLSASEINNLTEQLKHFKIYDLFDFVLGLDNIHAKSKVEVGKKYISDNKIDPNEVLFIGDTNHDALVAKEIGATPILYSNGHQSKAILEKENVLIIDDFRDLEKII